MLNQSFRDVFVTNTPTLLASGNTVDSLAVGQIAILDAKTYLSTTTPTYAKNKALFLVHGTPDLSGGALMDGNYDQNFYSKLIKGKKLLDFKGKKASAGQNQILTIGFSGDPADTNTISATNGDIRHLYLTLTGSPIDKLFSKQGITRHYIQEYPINSDCDDICAAVNPVKVAEDFALQINSDTQINRFVKASVIQSCETPVTPATQTTYVYQVKIADTQDDYALGLAQVQYPGSHVTRVGVQGILSVYEIQTTTHSTPAAYSNAGIVVVPDCGVCPAGYTAQASGYVYQVKRADAGSSGNLTTVKSDYGITGTETGVRVNYEFGTSTYILVSHTTLTVSGVDELTFVSLSQGDCVISSLTTTAWEEQASLTQYGKEFTITLGDTVCGENRLAELQAFYDDLVIAINDASGDCVHSYTTTVYSNAVATGCSVDLINYVKPQAFDGVQWEAAEEVFGTDCLAGIKIEAAYVNRITNDCTYDYFPYDADTVHMTASTFEPNYNETPDFTGSKDWKVRTIQSVKYPSGFGAYVRTQEQKALSYRLKERSYDPVVREVQGYSFQAQPTTYYDEYTLYYEYEVMVGGWGQKSTYRYAQVVYFPTGTGKNFEAAINGYLASAAIEIEPVVL